MTVESLMEQFDFVDCIKIDIEGYEYEILPKLIKYRDRIKSVVCEFHEKNNPHLLKKHNEIMEQMKKQNLLGNWLYRWI